MTAWGTRVRPFATGPRCRKPSGATPRRRRRTGFQATFVLFAGAMDVDQALVGHAGLRRDRRTAHRVIGPARPSVSSGTLQAVTETGYFNQRQLSVVLDKARQPLVREDRERAAAQQRAATAAESACAQAAASAAIATYAAVALARTKHGGYANRCGRALEEARQAALDTCNQVNGVAATSPASRYRPAPISASRSCRVKPTERPSRLSRPTSDVAIGSAMTWCSGHGGVGCRFKARACNGP